MPHILLHMFQVPAEPGRRQPLLLRLRHAVPALGRSRLQRNLKCGVLSVHRRSGRVVLRVDVRAAPHRRGPVPRRHRATPLSQKNQQIQMPIPVRRVVAFQLVHRIPQPSVRDSERRWSRLRHAGGALPLEGVPVGREVERPLGPRLLLPLLRIAVPRPAVRLHQDILRGALKLGQDEEEFCLLREF